MTQIDINDAVKISDNRKKMLEIQNCLLGYSNNLVEPHRVFLKQGILSKVCRRSNKKFTFFLFSDLLLYAEPLADRYFFFPFLRDYLTSDVRYYFHRSFSLESCRVDKGPANMPNSFLIVSPKKQFAVLADTQAIRDDWVKRINSNAFSMHLSVDSL